MGRSLVNVAEAKAHLPERIGANRARTSTVRTIPFNPLMCTHRRTARTLLSLRYIAKNIGRFNESLAKLPIPESLTE